MASRLQSEDVLQQITESDELWCESDDDWPDAPEEGDLESSIQRADPLDKAGAGLEDDEDEESERTSTDETTTLLPSQQPSTTIPLNLRAEDSPLPSTPVSLHTNDEVPVYSASHRYIFTLIPGPKVVLDIDRHPYDYFCQIWGKDTFRLIAAQTNPYANQRGTQ